MNKIIVVGYLPRDPEFKRNKANQTFVVFSVGSNIRGTKNETMWYSCIYWGDNYHVLQHVKKGSRIIVTGTLEFPFIYTAADGTRKASLSIQVACVDYCPGGAPPLPSKVVVEDHPLHQYTPEPEPQEDDSHMPF